MKRKPQVGDYIRLKPEWHAWDITQGNLYIIKSISDDYTYVKIVSGAGSSRQYNLLTGWDIIPKSEHEFNLTLKGILD